MNQLSLDEQILSTFPSSESELLFVAQSLGAESVAGWSDRERKLIEKADNTTPNCIAKLRDRIGKGEDPLGDAFCNIRSREDRRKVGATYTPHTIIDSMLSWFGMAPFPDRVVDPGCGSGRFLANAGRRFPSANLLGIEIDPLAAIIARANLAVRGFSNRSEVRLVDFRNAGLDGFAGRTLFVGNPPYVRHHDIERKWKVWLSETTKRMGLPSSQLCGLHLHFYLATALYAKDGDYGAYITAAEWMDVNYGALLRKLALDHLGVHALALVEPTARPFPDATTTASISLFSFGQKPAKVKFFRVADASSLRKLPKPKEVSVKRLAGAARWTSFTRNSPRVPKGYIELGELFRVHRGQVTGANSVWVVGQEIDLPDRVLFPTVTKARELFDAGEKLNDASRLRRVVDLPVDLDELRTSELSLVESFLMTAREKGAHEGYVAKNRKRWWAVGLREPAPILCTYMARRPPAFVENGVDARHINIAHGLYPRDPVPKKVLRTLVSFLSTMVSVNLGRTYAGGLTKFEPGEIERIPVPELSTLRQMAL